MKSIQDLQKEDSVMVAQNENGKPSKKDIWIIKLSELENNYNV